MHLADREAADRLVALLPELPEIRLAYMFGSRASGRVRAESDFDIALLVDDSAAAGDRGRLVRRLAGVLGRALASHLLDLVILNDAPPLLRHHVIRDGVLLHARSEDERVRFVARTIREYQDGEVRRREATRRRIARLQEERDDDGGARDLLEAARRAGRLLAQAEGVPDDGRG